MEWCGVGDGVQPLGEQGGEVELNLNPRPHLPHPGEEGEEEETDEEGKDGKEWKKYVEEEPQDLAVDEEKLKLSKYRHLTAETSFILLLHLTGHQTEDYRRNCQKGKFLFL